MALDLSLSFKHIWHQFGDNLLSNYLQDYYYNIKKRFFFVLYILSLIRFFKTLQTRSKFAYLLLFIKYFTVIKIFKLFYFLYSVFKCDFLETMRGVAFFLVSFDDTFQDLLKKSSNKSLSILSFSKKFSLKQNRKVKISEK